MLCHPVFKNIVQPRLGAGIGLEYNYLENSQVEVPDFQKYSYSNRLNEID